MPYLCRNNFFVMYHYIIVQLKELLHLISNEVQKTLPSVIHIHYTRSLQQNQNIPRKYSNNLYSICPYSLREFVSKAITMLLILSYIQWGSSSLLGKHPSSIKQSLLIDWLANEVHGQRQSHGRACTQCPRDNI